ncbi:ABC transporter permease DevC [Nostoc sp. JL33]|uniref:ABC transporter permease DevC n=1 Tax=Nostoc sp. JL33 TaxID=2815396 RepID=UPI0025D6CE2E|nr:ABC transporter permease DevC [Nostoc sp. JL33]
MQNWKLEDLKSSQNLWRSPTALAIIASLAIGGASVYTVLNQATANEKQAAPVAVKPVVKTVTALGRLEPNGEVIKLSATSSTEGSLLQKLLVKEGDRVKAGQVIAIMDSRDRLQASLVEAQKQVQVAKSNVDKVKAGAKQGEIGVKLADTVLFDRASRGDYKEAIAQVGQGKPVTTEIDRRTITISGLFSIGASFAADGNLITSDQNFLRLFPKREASSVSLGLVQLEAGYDPKQVKAALESHLVDNDVKVLTKAEFIEFETDYWKKNTAIGFIFSLGVGMGFMVGVIIVYQVLSTDVNSHMKEYATFKAMRYNNLYLLGVVFEEAIILAVLGFIPGAIAPLGLYYLTRNATNLPLYMTVARALTVLTLTMIMCIISSAIATRKLQSADPADMF